MNKWFIFLLVIFFLACENYQEGYEQLVRIDSLLLHEKTNSALKTIGEINPQKLDERCTAYYNLLKVQALYKSYIPIKSDSMINIAISYYEKTNDEDCLVKAYLYKANVLSELDKDNEAIIYLKKAEVLANKSTNKIIVHHIYHYLGTINKRYKEYKIALSYMKKAMEISKQIKRQDLLMYDYEQISACYRLIDQKDSVIYYIDKVASMMKDIPQLDNNDAYRIMVSLGNTYLDINMEKAKLFYENSLAIKPHGSAYAGLALICLKQNDTIKAKELFEKGFAIDGEIEPKIYNLNKLSRIEQETGNYKRANELLHEAQALKDSMAKKQQEDNIRAQQIEYDWMVEQKQTDREFLYALLAIIGVVLASGALTWYLLNRKRKAERKMKKEEAENSELKEIIFTKTEELKSANKELRSVSKKVQKLEAHQKEAKKEQRAKEKRLARGHQLYTELISGGNIILWKRQDIMDMVAYYRQVDPDFANRTDSNYENLTPSELLLLILEHIGKDDEEIMSIMNLNENAFRTLRFRTRQQGR